MELELELKIFVALLAKEFERNDGDLKKLKNRTKEIAQFSNRVANFYFTFNEAPKIKK